MSSQNNINKILVVVPAWLGDMVITQALLKTLKQQNPDLIIDVLANTWVARILPRMPEVNNIIEIPLRRGKLDLLLRYRFGKKLRAENYDQAILTPNSFKSALIPFWANIPVRTGWKGEMRWGLLNDLRLGKKKYNRLVDQFCALAFPLDASIPDQLPLPSLSVDQKNLHALVKHYKISQDKPLLVLCVGAEFGASRRWSTEHWTKLAQEKLKAGWQVGILGSKKEKPVADSIQAACENKCIDLTDTSILDAIDLLSIATTVVSNDSGLMHMAASLHRKLVVLYGSTSPAITPPLSDKAKIIFLDLPCQPCYKRDCPLGHFKCMNEIMPSLVLNQLQEV